MGNSYSLRDIGIVRLTFRPLFSEIYGEDKDKSWSLIKKYVFVWPKREASKTLLGTLGLQAESPRMPTLRLFIGKGSQAAFRHGCLSEL